jgi:AcrR family transcriptional regulator
MRWQPNARGRLEQAAIALYGESGFEQTTVAEIAKRAGLTERTFFRYFTDKREVLFSGSEALKTLLAEAVAGAAASASPIDAVAAGLKAVALVFSGRHEYARQRGSIIAANAELQERELIKLASLVSVVTEALRRRGVMEPAARLAAEAGIAAFHVAFERWVDQTDQKDLWPFIQETLVALKTVTAGH